MHAYITLSLLAGIRTEEARALRWQHLDLDGDLHADPPVPPHVAVWRSVRVHGETKTERSRRTLALPRLAVAWLCQSDLAPLFYGHVAALRGLAEAQAQERAAAGQAWQDSGLVFTSHLGATECGATSKNKTGARWGDLARIS